MKIWNLWRIFKMESGKFYEEIETFLAENKKNLLEELMELPKLLDNADNALKILIVKNFKENIYNADFENHDVIKIINTYFHERFIKKMDNSQTIDSVKISDFSTKEQKTQNITKFKSLSEPKFYDNNQLFFNKEINLFINIRSSFLYLFLSSVKIRKNPINITELSRIKNLLPFVTDEELVEVANKYMNFRIKNLLLMKRLTKIREVYKHMNEMFSEKIQLMEKMGLIEEKELE